MGAFNGGIESTRKPAKNHTAQAILHARHRPHAHTVLNSRTLNNRSARRPLNAECRNDFVPEFRAYAKYFPVRELQDQPFTSMYVARKNTIVSRGLRKDDNSPVPAEKYCISLRDTPLHT